MIGVDERMIDLGDVELSAAEAGAGQRPLLLLHGFTGAKEDFTDWLDRLAHVGWHAVAPDLRGHGASSKPTSEDAYSFEILADDVERLAECLDWPRFALLGHSMGGMAAQVVAVRAPGRLDALVLMDTGHGAVEGLDPQLVDAAVGIVRTQGIDALAELLEGSESPLDSPPHQRLLDRRPGYAEFEQRKFRATSPALRGHGAGVGRHRRPIGRAPGPAALAAHPGHGGRPGPAFHRPLRTHGHGHTRRLAGRHPRCRPQPTVREP
jgi:pimeloyl-ACP methyl ester carboxylesterase